MTTVPASPHLEANVLGTILHEGIEWFEVIRQEAGDDGEFIFWDVANDVVFMAMDFAASKYKFVDRSVIADVLKLTSDLTQSVLTPSISGYLNHLAAQGTLRRTEDLRGAVRALKQVHDEREALRHRHLDRERLVKSGVPQEWAENW